MEKVYRPQMELSSQVPGCHGIVGKATRSLLRTATAPALVAAEPGFCHWHLTEPSEISGLPGENPGCCEMDVATIHGILRKNPGPVYLNICPDFCGSEVQEIRDRPPYVLVGLKMRGPSKMVCPFGFLEHPPKRVSPQTHPHNLLWRAFLGLTKIQFKKYAQTMAKISRAGTNCPTWPLVPWSEILLFKNNRNARSLGSSELCLSGLRKRQSHLMEFIKLLLVIPNVGEQPMINHESARQRIHSWHLNHLSEVSRSSLPHLRLCTSPLAAGSLCSGLAYCRV